MKVDEIEGQGVGYFYAHSFSSWERGSNENNNKLIHTQRDRYNRYNGRRTEEDRGVDE